MSFSALFRASRSAKILAVPSAMSSCNDQWEVLGVSGGPTVEDAKAVAERAYEGITSKWVHMDVSPQEADQWIRTNHSEVICGFCGKLPTDVSGMIRGNGIAICFHCIDKLHTIAHSQ